MIRKGHKLPPNVESNIPQLLDWISKKRDIVALYAFGSSATGDLKPLSDFPANSTNRNDVVSILTLSVNLTKF